MHRKVRAKVLHGKIELLEDVELPEGEEVVVLVKQPFKSGEEVRAMLRRTAGAWAGTLDFDAFLADLRAGRKMKRPPVDLDR